MSKINWVPEWLKEHFTNVKGTATISSGAITAIVCDAAGIKFDEVPTITISGDGTGALATAVLDNNLTSNTYKEIWRKVPSGGGGYYYTGSYISIRAKTTGL